MIRRTACLSKLVRSVKVGTSSSLITKLDHRCFVSAASSGEQACEASVYSEFGKNEYADVDWDNLGFGLVPTDYMYMMKGSSNGIFVQGQLNRYGNIELNPAAGVLNYGQGIYEGMKAFRKENGNLLLFRPDQNAMRMKIGSERMCMPSPSLDQFIDAVKQTAQANKCWVPPPGKGSLYIRPLLIGSGPILGLAPSPEYTFLVYASPVRNYFKEGSAPLSIYVEEEYDRASRGGAGGVKSITNYAPVLKALLRAKSQGFSDVLYLDSVNRKNLEEVSSCNIFIVKGNVISTPATAGTILSGITRRSIIEIARDLGYQLAAWISSLISSKESKMGRAPCCDKANVKRGPWSPEEDSKLKSYIELHGTGGNWIALPQKIGLKRCGKSCRLRWLNYLRPNIKHGGFSEEEDNLICSLYISIGSRWSIIAAQLPGRTDNDIKNYWNTRLKKKLLGKHRKEHQATARRFAAGLKQQEIIKRGLIISNGNNSSMVNNHVAAADSQNPYWPELPVIQGPSIPNYSSPNQEVAVPYFNDHASIRKLLIKLGGRFHSHQDNVVQPKIQDVYSLNVNIQLPVDDQFPSSTQQIYHEKSAANMHSSASPIATVASNNISSPAQFAQMNDYNNHMGNAGDGDAMNMFQGGQSSHYLLSNELKDMVYNIDPEKLDGLEFLYSDDIMIMMNDRPISSTTSTNTSYGTDQSTIGWSGPEQMQLVYPPPPPLAASGSDYHEGMQRLIMPQEQCANFCGLSSYPGAGEQ